MLPPTPANASALARPAAAVHQVVASHPAGSTSPRMGMSKHGAPAVLHPGPGTATIQRVVRFGVHYPSTVKIAALEDAFRRQTLAYDRALAQARPYAENLLFVRQGANPDKAEIKDLELAIKGCVAQACKRSVTSSIMQHGMVVSVQATIDSWIGWRLRFAALQPGVIAKCEKDLADAMADPDAAVQKMQARKKYPITFTHVLTKCQSKLKRERDRLPPAYPTGRTLYAKSHFDQALVDLSSAVDLDEENTGRDLLARGTRIGRTPLSWGGAAAPHITRKGEWTQPDIKQGVSLIRRGNRLVAFLPGILPQGATHRRTPKWDGPVNLLGCDRPVKMGRAGVRVILSFSPHAYQYLEGYLPRTAKLVWVARGKYELHVVFEKVVETHQPRNLWLGLDRGVINMAALSAETGTPLLVTSNPLTDHINQQHRARELNQRKGAARTFRKSATRKLRELARCEVNRLAKHVARLVMHSRAHLAVENLDAFAKGHAKTLTKAQYGQLLTAIDSRLQRAGRQKYPGRTANHLWSVRAAYTSQTCAACGHQDKDSRVSRDSFCCTSCGHTADADANAAINIARKGRETFAAALDRKASGTVYRRSEGAASDSDAVVAVAPPAAASGSSRADDETPRGYGQEISDGGKDGALAGTRSGLRPLSNHQTPHEQPVTTGDDRDRHKPVQRLGLEPLS
jgi:putative transposase